MCRPTETYHTEVYKGYTIEIRQDDNATNPYKNTDGMYPMMTKGGRNVPEHDYKEAGAEFRVSTNLYRRHKKKLLECVNLPIEIDLRDARFPPTPDDTQNLFDDAVETAIRGHDYDTLEAIGNIIGVPCVQEHLTGYSQGDWMDVLVVCTKQFMKESGVTKKQALANDCKDMTLNANIYRAWAYGDVFGYIIKGPEGRKVEHDSCWGFTEPETYPAEDMYVTQEARMAVNAEIKWRKKKHAEQLKIWIRNHVPLNHRQPLSL